MQPISRNGRAPEVIRACNVRYGDQLFFRQVINLNAPNRATAGVQGAQATGIFLYEE
jgi:hypothetical protein